MATTTNFGWETPDDTDLVKDGAAAMRTLGSAIDTSLVDLKGGTTGQVLSKASGTDLDYTWVAQDDSNAIQNALLTTTGDTIYASGASTPARLGVGSTGQVLTVAGGVPSWATPASGALTLITSGTISSAANSGTTFDGVFTSTYINYLVLLSGLSHSAGTTNLLLQYRSAGPTTKTNEYYGGRQSIVAAGSVSNDYYNGGASTGVLLSYLHTSASSNTKLHITGVGNSSQKPLAHGTGFSGQGSSAHNTGFQCGDADTYTGFILSVASGTFSGTIKVYGVSN